jgi:hypothetical protein
MTCLVDNEDEAVADIDGPRDESCAASTREKKENTVTHAVVQNAAGGETEFAWRFHPGIRRSLSPRLFEAQEQNARLHAVFC